MSSREKIVQWRKSEPANKLFDILKQHCNPDEFKDHEKRFYYAQKDEKRDGYLSEEIDVEHEEQKAAEQVEEVEEEMCVEEEISFIFSEDDHTETQSPVHDLDNIPHEERLENLLLLLGENNSLATSAASILDLPTNEELRIDILNEPSIADQSSIVNTMYVCMYFFILIQFTRVKPSKANYIQRIIKILYFTNNYKTKNIKRKKSKSKNHSKLQRYTIKNEIRHVTHMFKILVN